MSPEECIAALDNSLTEVGEDFILRRIVSSAPVDVTCRARVSAVNAAEIAAGISQTDLRLILSPTQINAAAWPGQSPPAAPFDIDPSIPVPGDSAIVQGRMRTVAAPVDVQSINGVTVRINMRVTG